MELINQPFTGQLGNRLIELLEAPDYHILNIIVAFAKNSGVLRVKNSLEKFRAKGGIVNVYVGVDLNGTSYEALTALLLCTDSLNVVHSEKGQTFHPKIYQFLGKGKGLLIVGSHNLTGGGLWTNFESSVLLQLDISSANDNEVLKAQDDYISRLTSLKDSFMPIESNDDIDKLLNNGYISKEVSQQVRSSKANKKDGVHVRLFGNGTPAALPSQNIPKRETVAAAPEVSTGQTPIPQNDENETIWFETRSMTGGSRNILDLSKKSLVESGDPKGTHFDLGESGFMRGGVKFFGLDPIAVAQTKNITLNFEGVDYTDNTILYAPNNGSWRLQIKGESSSKVKITDVFSSLNVKEGERYDDNGELLLYLQFKVVTFSKVQDDYYFMTIYPESELEDLKMASRIVARNGSTKSAKQLGLL